MLRFERALMRIWNKDDRAAGLKKHLLRDDVVERVDVGFRLQHDGQVVEPGQRAHGRREIGRAAGKRQEIIRDAGVSGFRFKHRERGVGPRQCAFVFDLIDRRDGSGGVDRQAQIGGFKADRNRIEMRGVPRRQRNRAIE